MDLLGRLTTFPERDDALSKAVAAGIDYYAAKAQGLSDRDISLMAQLKIDNDAVMQASRPWQTNFMASTPQKSSNDLLGQMSRARSAGNFAQRFTGGGGKTGGGGNGGGGMGWGGTIGTVLAIEAGRQTTNPYIEEEYGDDWMTANNMAARAGQGAMIGGQFFPGLGHAIGAGVGADVGLYEGKTGNEFTSGAGQKDFLQSSVTGVPMGLMAYEDKLPSWLKWVSNPLYQVVRGLFK